MRGDIIEALNIVRRDDLVLSLLLLMREKNFAEAVEHLANAHPDYQKMIVKTVNNKALLQKCVANENQAPSED